MRLNASGLRSKKSAVGNEKNESESEPADSSMSDFPGADAPRASTGALAGRVARGYLRPYVGRLALAGLCMALAAVSQPALAWLMEPVIEEIFIARDATMLVIVPLAVMSVMVVGGFAIAMAPRLTDRHIG